MEQPKIEMPSVPPSIPRAPTVDLTKPLVERPVPGGSSVRASAMRVTEVQIRGSVRHSGASGNTGTSDSDWQVDAWAMYDLVGELRFLVNTLSGRMGQAEIYVGTTGDNPQLSPEPTTDTRLAGLLSTFGGGQIGMGQHIVRAGINLLIAGEIWFVGIPPELMPGNEPATDDGLATFVDPAEPPAVELNTLIWRALSRDEVLMKGGGILQLSLPEGQVETTPDRVFLFRTWRSHPRAAWEADSPTRASLPVLRELVGLTMHISSQVDSRLAGAGILLVPSSADRAMRNRLNIPDDSAEDPFTDALMQAMLTPIGDRASASAVVPLVVTAPDGTIEAFRHMSFDRPLDSEARPMREEAIRRLALGQDAPPELLLGTGSLNHWGAWLVREDVVTTHLEPPLALICDALTTQYLRPVMAALEYTPEQIASTVIWYNVEGLIVRPNRASDAAALHTKGIVGNKTLRNASGFDETDATEVSKMSEVDRIVLDMIRANPALVTAPGVQALRDQIQALVTGTALAPAPTEAPAPDEEADDETDDTDVDEPESDTGGAPATSDDDADIEGDMTP